MARGVGARRPARANDGRVATTESFAKCAGAAPIRGLPESDFTAKMMLENLPAGQESF